jgi:carbon monoxide dehydrogenase subunit G
MLDVVRVRLVADASRPDAMRSHIADRQARPRGNSARVRLAPQGAGTLIEYEYSAEISGKAAAVGGRRHHG